MTDPLNGWTGTYSGQYGKGPRHRVTVLVVPYQSVMTNGLPLMPRGGYGSGGSNPRTISLWMYVMSGQGDGGVYGYGTRSCTDGRNNIGRFVHSGAVPTIPDSVHSTGAGIQKFN